MTSMLCNETLPNESVFAGRMNNISNLCSTQYNPTSGLSMLNSPTLCSDQINVSQIPAMYPPTTSISQPQNVQNRNCKIPAMSRLPARSLKQPSRLRPPGATSGIPSRTKINPCLTPRQLPPDQACSQSLPTSRLASPVRSLPIQGTQSQASSRQTSPSRMASPVCQPQQNEPVCDRFQENLMAIGNDEPLLEDEIPQEMSSYNEFDNIFPGIYSPPKTSVVNTFLPFLCSYYTFSVVTNSFYL